MASTAQAVFAIARTAGIHQLGFDQKTRPLRASGHIALTGRGGGRGIVHADARELVCMILALAAPSMGRVVEVVETLSKLTWSDPQPGDWVSLADELEAEITRHAYRIMRGEPLHDEGGVTGWTLSVSADPPAAWLSWTIGGQMYQRHYAAPAGEQGRPMMHVVRIGQEIIDCAAELLADSFLGIVPKRKTVATPGREATASTGTCETKAENQPPACIFPDARGTEKIGWAQGQLSHGSGKSTPRTRRSDETRENQIAAMASD